MSKTKASLAVASDSFQTGSQIPTHFTAEGGNISPEISWSGVPGDAKSIAMIVDDPDANGFVHWVIYNVPADTKEIPMGQPNLGEIAALGQARQGRNGHGDTGYFGPKPPPGKPHHYHFHVYALDEKVDLSAGASKDDLMRAMSAHVLAQGELVGVYQSG